MKKIIITAAIVFAAITSAAIAQPYDCILVDGVKCYVIPGQLGAPDTYECGSGTTGSGSFVPARGSQPIPDKGPINADLTPVDIRATITEPTLGEVTTALDRTRTSSNTTITSNGPAGADRYPLTVDLKFYGQATLSAQPEAVYESRTELEFQASDINSILPFENARLTLQRDVEFYDRNDCAQRTAFTLRAGETSVTLGGNANNGGVR